MYNSGDISTRIELPVTVMKLGALRDPLMQRLRNMQLLKRIPRQGKQKRKKKRAAKEDSDVSRYMPGFLRTMKLPGTGGAFSGSRPTEVNQASATVLAPLPSAPAATQPKHAKAKTNANPEPAEVSKK